MTDKLTLQDFTYLINILKEKSKWELKELTKLLNVEIESLMYMLNIMSEIYSINGETFIDFEIDLAKETISFEYSTVLEDLSTITDFELFKIYSLLKNGNNLSVKNIKKQDLDYFLNILASYFDVKANIDNEDGISIFLSNDINIDYVKIGYEEVRTYAIKPLTITNNKDGNVLEAIDLVDNRMKTFLINRIISVDEVDKSKSSSKDTSKNIEVKFKYKNELFLNKLNKEKAYLKDGLCIYTFRDFNVALEFLLENFMNTEIVAPKNLKTEYDKKINNLIDKINS